MSGNGTSPRFGADAAAPDDGAGVSPGTTACESAAAGDAVAGGAAALRSPEQPTEASTKQQAIAARERTDV
jgi:hypothetical protein